MTKCSQPEPLHRFFHVYKPTSASQTLTFEENTTMGEKLHLIQSWLFSPIILVEHAIGCFKTPSGLFSKTLGDFRAEAKTDPNQAVMQCGELAHRNGYRVFALGFDGLCMSGADAKNKYYKHKQPGRKTDADKCSGVIGQGPLSVVYSFGNDVVSFY